MNRPTLGALLLLLASAGCCTCNHCNDYGSPVQYGPYVTPGMRAGSAMAEDSLPANAEGEAITPLTASRN